MYGETKIEGGKVYQYYVCKTANKSRERYLADAQCSNGKRYLLPDVETAIWEWLKELFTDDDALLTALQETQAAREVRLTPMLQELEAIDTLITRNRQEQARLLDLYVGDSDFPQELLNAKNASIEKALADLHTRRAKLQAEVERQALSAAQIKSIMGLRDEVLNGILEAEDNFHERRRNIEKLEVTGELAIEDGQPVLHAHCIAGDKLLHIETTTTSIKPGRRTTPRRSTQRKSSSHWRCCG